MNGIPNAPLWTRIAFSAMGVIAFAVFAYLGGTDFGGAAAFAILAISVAAFSRWDLRNRSYFWIIIFGAVAAHVIILTRIRWVLPHPVILVAPIVTLDFILIVAAICGAEQWLDGPAD